MNGPKNAAILPTPVITPTADVRKFVGNNSEMYKYRKDVLPILKARTINNIISTTTRGKQKYCKKKVNAVIEKEIPNIIFLPNISTMIPVTIIPTKPPTLIKTACKICLSVILVQITVLLMLALDREELGQEADPCSS